MNSQLSSKKFAMTAGLFMIAWGLMSLIPGLSVYSQSLPDLYVENSYGYFLGTFAMNILSKSFYLLMGIAGVACANMGPRADTEETIHTLHTTQSFIPAVWWSRVLLVITGALTVFGLFSGSNTLGGYWPLFGHNVWLNAFWAILGGYFGYIAYEDRNLSHSPRNLHRI